MITKLLASAAIVLGAAGVAAPASADPPTPTPTPHPAAGVNDPFSGLNCAPSPCQKGMPSLLDPQWVTQEIQRGISDGLKSPDG